MSLNGIHVKCVKPKSIDQVMSEWEILKWSLSILLCINLVASIYCISLQVLHFDIHALSQFSLALEIVSNFRFIWTDQRFPATISEKGPHSPFLDSDQTIPVLFALSSDSEGKKKNEKRERES
ncbi:hypothetical protein PMAYCL1PPCAC_06363, partial [Pristionchus mayeri]